MDQFVLKRKMYSMYFYLALTVDTGPGFHQRGPGID